MIMCDTLVSCNIVVVKICLSDVVVGDFVVVLVTVMVVSDVLVSSGV